MCDSVDRIEDLYLEFANDNSAAFRTELIAGNCATVSDGARFTFNHQRHTSTRVAYREGVPVVFIRVESYASGSEYINLPKAWRWVDQCATTVGSCPY